MDIRKYRKKQHIKYSIQLEKYLKRESFKDVQIVHNCLSEVDINEVDLSTNLGKLQLKTPIIINAITGGFNGGEIINRELAKVARDFNLAMAVGSQKIAIDSKESEKSFKVVRKVNPEGIIFANVGADISVKDALLAIQMLDADALQVHLNVPQELIMAEGRKNFKGTLNNIKNIVDNVNVPVIIKEVGFGIAKEEAQVLIDNGVKIIDISGAGGTNFIAIENMRNSKVNRLTNLEKWGIPTAVSLVEVVKQVKGKADVIASGGLSSGLDAAKALAIGAKGTAFAGVFLYILIKNGPMALRRYIKNVIKELKYCMVMSGAKNLGELRQRPTVIGGKTCKWLKNRGIQL